MDTSTPLQSFHLFSRLPTELRLKIWRACLPSRVIEVNIKQRPLPITPDPEDEADFGPSGSVYRPLTRPALPIAFQVCRESRSEALSQYRPAAGASFESMCEFPWNLYNPALDTLYFPRSLYSMQITEASLMWSAAASLSLGMPREFVLDRLAEDVADVAEITSLAISWSDIHVKDVNILAEALKPYKSLRELSLTFFELREDSALSRFMNGGNVPHGSKMQVLFMNPSDGKVGRRYLERMLEEHEELAKRFNEELKGIEETAEQESGWRAPKVLVKLAKFF
jgi:hypothetical protein